MGLDERAEPTRKELALIMRRLREQSMKGVLCSDYALETLAKQYHGIFGAEINDRFLDLIAEAYFLGYHRDSTAVPRSTPTFNFR